MPLKILFFTLLLASSLCACRGKKPKPEKEHEPKGLPLSGVQPVLEGNWIDECEPEIDEKARSSLLKIQYSGSAQSYMFTEFNDSSCTEANKIALAKRTFDFKLNGNKIDLVLQQQVHTPTSDLGKTESQAKCPDLIWEVGKETDVSNCKALAVAPDAKTIFDIVDIQEGELYFGYMTSFHDGRSEAKRPTQLNGSSPLTKQ